MAATLPGYVPGTTGSASPNCVLRFAHAEAYPEEIERRIALDESVSPEWLDAKYPYLRPRAGLRPRGNVAERA
jgi:hypothetical protein